MSTEEGANPRLVLSNVSMATVALEDMIPAAAAAGFDGVSVLGRVHRSARRRGLSDGDVAKLAADHGVAIDCIEATGDWLSEPPDGPPWMSAVYSWQEYIRIGAAIGADTLVAVHFGDPHPVDESAEAFTRLCKSAGDHGLRVALEFPAWATIGDVGAAWDVVKAAGQDNGGLLVDNWHHRRGGNDDDALRRVDADRIFCIQVCDAATDPIGPPEEDVLHRRLPGEGGLEVAAFLRQMKEMDVRASIAVEVFDSGLLESGPLVAAHRLYRSLRAVIDQASQSGPAAGGSG